MARFWGEWPVVPRDAQAAAPDGCLLHTLRSASYIISCGLPVAHLTDDKTKAWGGVALHSILQQTPAEHP